MSYTPKQQGASGSSGNQQSQQAKALAGITQQMQNLVHSQNALPQTSQAGLGAVNFTNLNILQQQQQQQRLESIIKQQQLLFSANPQIQQHLQQQIQQQQNAAKDLLNKSLQQHHQQQANGSTSSVSLASNLANQQLHQQLQAFAQNPANLMQQIQAYQYQMQQQQQHQQKIMPLNQTQQSLAGGQLDVQNVTQQHMQQIQQTLQQQKLLASHTKSLSAVNQMKPPVTSSSSSTSVSIGNASIQIQPNNNSQNKTSIKGTVSSAVHTKQTSTSGPAKQSIQTIKTHNIGPPGPPKPIASQITVKPSPSNYMQKAQCAPVSLTRISGNNASCSPPVATQQISRSSNLPYSQAPTKVQQQPQMNYGKSDLNTHIINKSSKQSSVGVGKSDDTVHKVQQAITVGGGGSGVGSDVELKNQEETTQSESVVAKYKTDQKEKAARESPEQFDKEELKGAVNQLKEFPESKQEKGSEGDVLQQSTTASSIQPSIENKAQSSANSMLEGQETNNTAQKIVQKIPPRSKSIQHNRNVLKIEKEKVEKMKVDKDKSAKLEKKIENELFENEKTEKSATESEKKEKESEQKQEEANDGKQKKDKVKEEKIENEAPNKAEEEKADSERVKKEKVMDSSQAIKPEKKRSERNSFVKSTKETPSNKKPQTRVGNSIQQFPTILNDERRSKRHRLKTILYQSPLPELAYITKLSVSETTSNLPRSNEDKLILFYKSEYLAVRNAEGGFFICQTLQNVYKSSKRIRIRWFSEDNKDNNIFNPDFYDNTDLECVLTTVDLEKVGKDKFQLPKPERTRIENILRKAMDVEKGIAPKPSITEENPDGLDISLLKTESQITRKSSKRKRAASKSPKRSRAKLLKKKKSRQKKFNSNEGSSHDDDNEEDDNNDKEYKPSRHKRSSVTTGVEQPKQRAQRSPLAKTRRISPSIASKKTETQQINKPVPMKSPSESQKEKSNVESNSISATVANKNERPKRKAAESIISYDEELVAAKRLGVSKQTRKDNTTLKTNDKSESNTKSISSEENQTSTNIDATLVLKSETNSSYSKPSAPIAAAVVAAATIPSSTTILVATTTSSKTATGVSLKRKKLPSLMMPSMTNCSSATSTTIDTEKDKNLETTSLVIPPLSSSIYPPSSSSASVNRLTRSRK